MTFDPIPLINVPLRRWNPTSQVKNFPFYLLSPTLDTNVALTGGSNPETQRFSPVLDAIASACISEAKQVVATTLTLPKNDQAIIMCIAQNDEVSPNTVFFMENLWKDMQKFSTALRMAAQMSTHDVETIVSPHGREVADERTHIFERCYEHGILKFKQRLMKRWKVFAQLVGFLVKSGSDEEETRGHLIFVYRVFRDVIELMDSDQTIVPTNIIIKVRKLMSAGWPHCKVLRKKAYELQMFADEFKQETSIVFSLHHYLNKCYFLHTTIGTLAGFAASPKHSPMFSRKLHVKCIPSEAAALTLWEHEHEWPSYFIDVYEKCDLYNGADLVALRDVARSSAKFQRENPLSSAPVHSQDRAAVTPSLDYIGCSKLSCYVCQRYFDAYNHASNDKNRPMHFYTGTRGSHYKVYPWAMPSLNDSTDARIRETMTKSLCTAYETYLTARGQARPRIVSESGIVSVRTVEDELMRQVAGIDLVQPRPYRP